MIEPIRISKQQHVTGAKRRKMLASKSRLLLRSGASIFFLKRNHKAWKSKTRVKCNIECLVGLSTELIT